MGQDQSAATLKQVLMVFPDCAKPALTQEELLFLHFHTGSILNTRGFCLFHTCLPNNSQQFDSDDSLS